MAEYFLEIYGKIQEKLKAECGRLGEKIPYIAENGRYQKDMREENNSWWTNGFWAGMLWQMYHATGEEIYKTTAEHSELALDQALADFVGLHHDVGFQFLHTAVADYRLTGRERSKVRGFHAAGLLAGRFNPAGGYIRAWNLDKTGFMIIDCLMNIPLLYWAGKELNDPRYAEIADIHAHTALRVLLREDGSCNHIAVFDPSTGELLECPAGQGYEVGSSWSRGQAWAVYGFALAFLHTGSEEYLAAAKRAAHYFLANVALTGGIARTDFRGPGEVESYDTTASACAACGLLQIAQMVPEKEKGLYRESARKMLMALVEGYCNWDVGEDGILQGGTVAYGKAEETHVPIVYGDYFLVEGVLRVLGEDFLIW